MADFSSQLPVQDNADGAVSPGTAATQSILIGGIFNTSFPTAANGQQLAVQLDSSGRMFIAPLTNSSVVKAQLQDNAGNALNSTSNALNTFLTNSSLSVTQGTSPWVTSRNWTLASGTDSVSAVQSGAWSTGRTWTLSSGSDSVSSTQSGTWTVQPGNTQNTTPWLTQDSSDGPVTPGTVASKSQLMGGQFNTALPTLTNTQQSALQLDSSGRLIIAPLTNSSIVKAQLQDNSGVAITLGQKTMANSVPVTIASDQSAVPASQSGTWTVSSKTQDGSGNPITSDSPGTTGNQRLHTATPDTTSASTALGALNAAVSLVTAGTNSVGFQITAGTLIGTLTPECSIDGGTTWTACTFYDPANSAVTSSLVFTSNNTTKVLSILPIGGASNVRVRVSAYTSGTANSLMRSSLISGASGAITSAAFGTVSNTFPSTTANTPTLILSSNVNRKYAYIANSTGSSITIQFSSGTGLTNTTGLEIPARSYYELKGDNLYTGNIYAFCSSSITLSVTEGTP